MTGPTFRRAGDPMMRSLLALSALVILSACATPRQQCEARATRDLRVVNALIDESRAILERGYAFETVADDRLRYTFCLDRDGNRTLCWVRDRDLSTRPVAVNLDEERAKLESLLKKKEELEVEARAALAACRALPDG